MTEYKKKIIYTTLYSQVITTDGKYLIVGNNFGDIATFKFVILNLVRIL